MFSKILRKLREADGLSQIRFAEEIDFSQAAVSAWENNTREPGIEALLQISKFFNVSVDYLVKGENFKPETRKEQYSPTVELTAEEKELLDNYRQLPKDLKHRAEAYMEKLVEVLNEEDVRPISAPSTPSSQTPRSTLRITRRR
jgi:transcriptional regulator with XRE-family HTH domain